MSILYIFASFLLIQANADLVDDAESALSNLRLTIANNLNGALLEQVKLSAAVDSAALTTKESNPNVESCVNDQASEAISFLEDRTNEVTGSILKTTYDFELQIILCGRSDADCLNDVISQIQDATSNVAGTVNDDIEVNRQKIEDEIELIQACATKV